MATSDRRHADYPPPGGTYRPYLCKLHTIRQTHRPCNRFAGVEIVEHHVIEARHGEHEWVAVEGFAHMLERLDWQRVRRVDELSEDELVKDNTVRTVVRLDDPTNPEGTGYYVKRYKFKRSTDCVKYLVRPTKARQEWNICGQLKQAGIPTCDVLAMSHSKSGPFYREAFLVSREIAGTVELKDFVEQKQWRQPGAPGKMEIVRELADLSGQLARKGFYHKDYHSGNILVRPSAPAGSRLFVLDLHSIYKKRAVGRRHALRMLAFLGTSFSDEQVNDRERLRFLLRFLQRWKGQAWLNRGRAIQWARLARKAVRGHHRRHMRSRTKRCVKESSMFTGHARPPYTVHRRRDMPADYALQAAEMHSRILSGESSEGKLCKNGTRTEVTLCPLPGVPPADPDRPVPEDELTSGAVCVKSFFPRSVGERLKDAFRWRSRARAAWVALRGAAVRGIPVPRPLALLERGRLSSDRDFLIMEAVNDGQNLEDLVSSPLPRHERVRLCKTLANLLETLQKENVYHPDMKPTNVLVERNEAGFDLYLIDMGRVRFESEGGRERWIRYLAQLNAGLPGQITLLDRMRFLRECGRGRWNARERREIATAVYEKSLERNPKWLR